MAIEVFSASVRNQASTSERAGGAGDGPQSSPLETGRVESEGSAMGRLSLGAWGKGGLAADRPRDFLHHYSRRDEVEGYRLPSLRRPVDPTGKMRKASPPEVVPEPGWAPIDPLRLEGGRGAFVSGEPEGERLRGRDFWGGGEGVRGFFASGERGGDRLRVRYFWRGGDRPLVGRAWFGPGAEGPPGHAPAPGMSRGLRNATAG